MTYLPLWHLGCDKPEGDGYCPEYSPVETAHERALMAAKARGWTVTGEGGLHICPRHGGALQ